MLKGKRCVSFDGHLVQPLLNMLSRLTKFLDLSNNMYLSYEMRSFNR